MRGKTVRLALLPKFSSLVGDETFRTDPINVVEFESAEIAYWRATLIGSSSPSFLFKLEGSIDGDSWTEIHFGDPGAGNETLFGLDSIDYPLMRAVVVLTGVGVAATCWAYGTFTLRKKR